MQVVVGRPPNYAAIVAAFPSAARKTVIFCYGRTIFAPGGANLHRAIVDHEKIHSDRQLARGIESWWDQYLASAQFRLQEEIPAHKAEYETLQACGTRNQRRGALREIAHKLAAPLYGNLITVHEAKRLIGGADANL